MRVALLILGAAIQAAGQGTPVVPITIDYPLETSVFPPEFPPPTFLWRDAAPVTTAWRIEVTFRDGLPGLQVLATGERLKVGDIDPRCIAETNELPKLTPEQAAARVWKPESEVWAVIKQRSRERPATITIAGYRAGDPARVVSRGERLLMEEIDYSMLFRGFVGMNLDEPVWDVTVFTKNRNRLLEGDVAPRVPGRGGGASAIQGSDQR